MTRTLVRTALRTCTSIKEGDRKELSSLDVRHAAGAADMASQRHKSWALVSAPFDDCGMAGGSLERPALRRHFSEVGAGSIDLSSSTRSTGSPGRWPTSPASSIG
jgi:hypothetical protein